MKTIATSLPRLMLAATLLVACAVGISSNAHAGGVRHWGGHHAHQGHAFHGHARGHAHFGGHSHFDRHRHFRGHQHFRHPGVRYHRPAAGISLVIRPAPVVIAPIAAPPRIVPRHFHRH